ncbi:hypothetical protein [Chryseosolibacter indicus]|uniref:Class IIb bacteriocin, lactobin A/cerein 7B family n=1 Tax=Chryseosolibacter indicus TaxID=2782351 RepID=A0ABS5VV46_9BACT|nr:hypothetical protein [Chryseosolibacter indicus]MBT1705315.1 hypothetical protein [Chryseosolibacter indicus]
MQNLNLQEFAPIGVVELNQEESNNTNGGILWAILNAALVISAIDNFGDIREGLVDGWNGTPRH